MGRKAAAVVRDAVSKGVLSSTEESIAASTADFPCSICTMTLSDITMPLSTSMPRAMISAAREIWSRPIDSDDITIIDSSMVTGIRLDTTRPVRKPKVASITRLTTAMACSRLTTKPLTFSSTSRGEKLTSSKSIPIG